jgi:predicted nucleic acid-binding protein
VNRRLRKYVLDTQLFVNAFRDPVANQALQRLEVARVSKAFANDILLALSCREAGCVLVTENDRDFSRIRRFIAFEYIQPWPARRDDVIP